MNAVNPAPEQLRKVLADTPKDQPVVMLNLLRFRDKANYADDSGDRSGREAYQLYMHEAWLVYTSPSRRDRTRNRMPSSA